jgi:Zn/Cd-binding protein ZinT
MRTLAMDTESGNRGVRLQLVCDDEESEVTKLIEEDTHRRLSRAAETACVLCVACVLIYSTLRFVV